MNKLINQALCEELLQSAALSPRKRSHHNFHDNLNEPVQRLLIGMVPGSYVQPHLHPQAHKWEMTIALKGETVMLQFDAHGRVIERLLLSPTTSPIGIEIPPNTWHTVFPVNGPSVIMELKQGPYQPGDRCEFAGWAPAEGSPEVPLLLNKLLHAEPGDCCS